MAAWASRWNACMAAARFSGSSIARAARAFSWRGPRTVAGDSACLWDSVNFSSSWIGPMRSRPAFICGPDLVGKSWIWNESGPPGFAGTWAEAGPARARAIVNAVAAILVMARFSRGRGPEWPSETSVKGRSYRLPPGHVRGSIRSTDLAVEGMAARHRSNRRSSGEPATDRSPLAWAGRWGYAPGYSDPAPPLSMTRRVIHHRQSRRLQRHARRRSGRARSGPAHARRRAAPARSGPGRRGHGPDRSAGRPGPGRPTHGHR